MLNIELDVFSSSGDVLQEIRQRKPDLLVIDFILNDDNGGGLCHQVKSDMQLHELPIILLSEYTTLDRIASKFGCSTVVNKPISQPDLYENINNLLQQQAVS
ncbi:response regulator [Inquilinus sp. KBS0705]|nr:response regulator [Inquilinus sp. KBS0705]